MWYEFYLALFGEIEVFLPGLFVYSGFGSKNIGVTVVEFVDAQILVGFYYNCGGTAGTYSELCLYSCFGYFVVDVGEIEYRRIRAFITYSAKPFGFALT